jgi:hypothetical protein
MLRFGSTDSQSRSEFVLKTVNPSPGIGADTSRTTSMDRVREALDGRAAASAGLARFEKIGCLCRLSIGRSIESGLAPQRRYAEALRRSPASIAILTNPTDQLTCMAAAATPMPRTAGSRVRTDAKTDHPE